MLFLKVAVIAAMKVMNLIQILMGLQHQMTVTPQMTAVVLLVAAIAAPIVAAVPKNQMVMTSTSQRNVDKVERTNREVETVL